MEAPLSTQYPIELTVGLEAVLRSCDVADTLQQSLKESEKLMKADASPVTLADLSIQAIVAQYLSLHLPTKIRLVAEEDLRAAPQSLLEGVAARVNSVIPNREGAPDWTVDDVLQVYNATRYGEEQLKDSPYRSYWILDPIDGTKGFIRGSQYAIALAYVSNGRPAIGILGCPNLPHDLKDPNGEKGCIIYAARGEGAKMIYLKGSDWKSARLLDLPSSPIHVQQPKDEGSVQFMESYEAAHSDQKLSAKIAELIGAKAPPMQLDSQAKYGLVARGDGHLILRFPRPGYRENVWDHSAGTVIIEEAGGKVTHADGSELDYKGKWQFDNQSGIVVSSGGQLHSMAIKAIQGARGG